MPQHLTLASEVYNKLIFGKMKNWRQHENDKLHAQTLKGKIFILIAQKYERETIFKQLEYKHTTVSVVIRLLSAENC